jgi:hypothetical protein
MCVEGRQVAQAHDPAFEPGDAFRVRCGREPGANHLQIQVGGVAGGTVAAAIVGRGDEAASALLTHANSAPGCRPQGQSGSSGRAPPASGDDKEFVPDFRDTPLAAILDDLAQG